MSLAQMANLVSLTSLTSDLYIKARNFLWSLNKISNLKLREAKGWQNKMVGLKKWKAIHEKRHYTVQFILHLIFKTIV